MKFFTNLFKTRNQKIKEACQDIHQLIGSSKETISDMQRDIQSIQDGIRDLQESLYESERLNKWDTILCEKMLSTVREVEGEKE
ncbi:hypothetical protein ABXS71_06195 [Bacillus infantis]|uniref:hypothetical protein n=1 Tax=Bacillus infantis TaxID=324767 RepID=UPI00344CC65C